MSASAGFAARLLSLCLAWANVSYAQTSLTPGRPPEGWVSKPETAIEIAKAVVQEKLGEKAITDRGPFAATLNERGIWTVRAGPLADRNVLGGDFYLQLHANTGQLIGIFIQP
jgi:hypothetical protein